jgi:hypothetical protein
MFAENVVKDQVQKSLATEDKPSVSLGGFPFLTQLLGQKFQRVEVDITGADAGRVRVEHVHAVLTGVKRAGDGALVDSLSGGGLITYADATAAARPFAVSYGGSGLVKLTGKVTFAGQTRSVSASGKPRIQGNQLIIKPENVSSPDVPGGGAQIAGLVPDIKIPLRQIPAGLTIKINPTEAGIEFSFDGENLELSSKDITAAWGLIPVQPGPSRTAVSSGETAYARPRSAT